MSSLHARGVALHRNPTYRDGLAALVAFLMDRGYHSRAIGHIFDHVAVGGTLAGTDYLDPADEAEAERVFCDALPAIGLDSEAWDKPDAFLDAEWLAAGNHPFPFVEPDDVDRSIPPGVVLLPPEMLELPPLCGGSPEADAFEPTAADREDYGRWSAELDARRASAEYLDRFNEERQDGSERPA